MIDLKVVQGRDGMLEGGTWEKYGRDPSLPGRQHMDLFTSRGNCQLRPKFLQLISNSDDGQIIFFSDDKKSDPSYVVSEMCALVIC